jgi:hypothetical protein
MRKIIRNLHMILPPLLIYKKMGLFIRNIMQMMNSHINSNSLDTVTNGRKDKVSQKKKASIKPKDETSSSVALVEKMKIK